MKLNAYAVWDEKAESYMQPMFFRTNAEAIRAFSSATVDPEHSFCKHASDYTLFHVGEYDDQTGALTPVVLVSLGNALQYKSAAMNS